MGQVLIDGSGAGWIDALWALFVGGGGYRMLTHEQRIKRLESEATKASDLGREVSEMSGKLDGIGEAVSEIREWIMGRAK